MPLYDYQCDHCLTTFEVRAFYKEKEHGLKPACPNCQSVETHQLLTAGLYVRSASSDGSSLSPSFCGPNSGSGCCD
jgi:putative FmdB family regulatory protein